MNGVWTRPQFSSQRATIVFVHGILSSGDSCWSNKSGVTWPRLVAEDSYLDCASILVFSYRTALGGGRYSISDAADALWMELAPCLAEESAGPLIFVCHSMGGIVVRKMIVKRQLSMPSGVTLGLFLVASPSIGSRWATLLSPFIWLFHHSQASALRLSESNEWLRDLKNEFRLVVDRRNPLVLGKELLEEQPVLFGCVPWIPPVVRKVEGEVFFPDSLVVPGSDHFSVAKPRHQSSTQHIALRQFVNHVVQVSSQVVFSVPANWHFHEVAKAISSVEQLSVEFIGFEREELETVSLSEVTLKAPSSEEILRKLYVAFPFGRVGRYTVTKQGSSVILQRHD